MGNTNDDDGDKRRNDKELEANQGAGEAEQVRLVLGLLTSSGRP